MSALTPPANSPTSNDPAAVRVVLFGMPDAGKSSLLGALSQAAHNHAKELRGQLADPNDQLGELRLRVYGERPQETQAEIVPYPVRFTPSGGETQSAVLYDCDGRVANEYLTQKRSLVRNVRSGPLGDAVLNADSLILTIDASAPDKQIEGDFREFLRFLRYLVKHRAREHAVGGMPVFLVLTKCDLLAGSRMLRSEWEARIAQRQREVETLFHQFLANQGEFSFGSLHLDVRATAVHFPSLADEKGQPREPVGVAELFREAIAGAAAFRDRRWQSSKRLALTVGGAVGFLASLLIAGIALFYSSPPPDQSALAARVEALKATEGPDAGTRLGPALENRLREFTDILKHPDYETLPDSLRTYVRLRFEEGEAYLKYRDELAEIPSPAKARSLAELKQIETSLTKLSPPAASVGEWASTPASKTREELLKREVPALREAVGKLTQHYFTSKNRSATLLAGTAEITTAWAESVKTLLADVEKIPIPKGGPQLGVAFLFDEVTRAQAEWQSAQQKLTRVRDLATALGMVAEAPGRGPIFPASELPAGADILDYASRRLQQLKNFYPDYEKWSAAELPDEVRDEFKKRLRRAMDQTNREGQRLIQDRLRSINPSEKEQVSDWPRIADYLLSPPLKDWREITAILARIDDPKAEDPVGATAAFLKQPSFEIDLKAVRVRIPDTLSDTTVKPAGDLRILQTRSDGTEAAIVLKSNAEQRDKQAVAYTFGASGNTKLTIRPGEMFLAELPVRRGESKQKFSWVTSRTGSFAFEKLANSPRMHAENQTPAEGVPADGVTVSVEGIFPQVPAMLPMVNR